MYIYIDMGVLVSLEELVCSQLASKLEGVRTLTELGREYSMGTDSPQKQLLVPARVHIVAGLEYPEDGDVTELSITKYVPPTL